MFRDTGKERTMEKKSLTIYKASAGSGKTFKLTQHYLSLALCSEKNYARILAITFTRKATAEMRKRIIDELVLLAKEPSKSDHCETLRSELGIDEQEIQLRADRLLSAIIHDYSNFSVTTIDQFFQRIIRSLTRELGISGNYRIEMDEGKILTQAVESMFESAMTIEPLFRLLSDYIQNQIVTEGKSHMIQRSIVEFVKSMLREDLKDSFINRGSDNFDDQIVAIQKEMSRKAKLFEQECTQRLQAVEQCMASHGMKRSQLSQRGCNVTKFYKLLLSKEFGEKILNEIFQSDFADIDDPLSIFPKALFKEASKVLAEQVAYEVLSLFQTDYQYFISEFPAYFLSKNGRSRLWHIRFFGYIWREMNKIKTDENIFIIGDAPVLLSQIAEKTDTPFIFERIANHYNHFMIDEFQDTSILQWKNLGPFLENSMSQFSLEQQKSLVNNLIVGDVKQAIYRFRNGDWSLLDHRVQTVLGDLGIQEEVLNTNWRSEKVIVDFNNQVFDILPNIIPLDHFARIPVEFREALKNIYSNQKQQVNPKKIDALEKGSVRIEAIPPDNYRGDTIDRVCSQVFSYLNVGVAMGRIAILVRTSDDGREIAQQLLSYNPEETGYKLQIAMSDVLSVDKSVAVQAIVQVLYYLSNPDEQLYLWLAAYQICSLNGRDLTSFFENSLEGQLPEQFFTDLEDIKKMPIHEAVAYLISLFGLYKNINEVPYLARFQNIVTLYVQNYGSDRYSFLLYWEEDGRGLKMPTPSSLDAIQILTVHKSKGLEFEHVIIPFVDWSVVHGGSNDIWITDDSQKENLFLPVPFNKAAEFSTYSSQLHNEYFKMVVDSLNIIYVGFTRAVQSLVVYFPQKEKKGTVGLWLQNLLNSGFAWKGDFETTDTGAFSAYSYGTGLNANLRESNLEVESKTISELKINTNPSIAVRTVDRHYPKPDDGELSKVEYGTVMHKIMEQITTVDSLDFAIEKIKGIGLLLNAEADLVREKIKFLITHPDVEEWFSNDSLIINEHVLIDANGKLRRPDRIIRTKDGRWIVLDYKFGAEQAEHKDQVLQYVQMLSKTGRNVDSAYLWYMMGSGVVRVV